MLLLVMMVFHILQFIQDTIFAGEEEVLGPVSSSGDVLRGRV